jgi:hypothetical protein
MADKPKRVRINAKNQYDESHVVSEYEHGFQPNLASKNARLTSTHKINIPVDYWVEKHYVNRKNYGDENGEREGIDEDVIEALVKKAFQHLMYYSFRNPKFKFVNFPPIKGNQGVRIMLRESSGVNQDLHVPVEYHYLGNLTYESTVITAMKQEGFRISEGQYVIEFDGDDSYLLQSIQKKLNQIDSCL